MLSQPLGTGEYHVRDPPQAQMRPDEPARGPAVEQQHEPITSNQTVRQGVPNATPSQHGRTPEETHEVLRRAQDVALPLWQP